MRVKPLNDEEIAALAGAEDTPVGRAILRACAIEAERVQAALEDPMLDTKRIRDDFRHALGEMRGVNAPRRAVEAAKRKLGITTGSDE